MPAVLEDDRQSGLVRSVPQAWRQVKYFGHIYFTGDVVHFLLTTAGSPRGICPIGDAKFNHLSKWHLRNFSTVEISFSL